MFMSAKSFERGAVQPAVSDQVELLDGGSVAFPRMLAAIAAARISVYLEVYLFCRDQTGQRFLAALEEAARRGVRVKVVADGWGSARDGRAVASELRRAGCEVRIHNRLTALLLGRFGRTHRKLLLVDDCVAFVGGINIADEYGADARTAWADLAVEVRGPACARLASQLRGERAAPAGRVRIHLSGLGGGARLRRRYLKAIRHARERIDLAQGYFLPDAQVLRALARAARGGVRVTILLAGRTDVPFTRVATRYLYRQLLAAGVHIREWTKSVLHAKAAVVDGKKLLVGSFNLDPLSLFMMEALVEVDDRAAARAGEAWMRAHQAVSREIGPADCGPGGVRGWLLAIAGFVLVRAARWLTSSAMPHHRQAAHALQSGSTNPRTTCAIAGPASVAHE
jgi:cardiolipin synthase A/B